MKIGEVSSDQSLAGRRDAMHVPVVLVHSETDLQSKVNVRFSDDTYTKVHQCDKSERHGIVDPFLADTTVKAGTVFHILLEPNMVQNLVHHFELTSVNQEVEEDETDDECAGCYGSSYDDSDDDDYSCRGCY